MTPDEASARAREAVEKHCGNWGKDHRPEHYGPALDALVRLERARGKVEEAEPAWKHWDSDLNYRRLQEALVELTAAITTVEALEALKG